MTCMQAQALSAPETLQAGSFDEAVQTLSDRVLAANPTQSAASRWVIGISGVPGSGKSTIAKAVAAHLNELQKDQHFAVAVGMDGFHYTRAQLDGMEDPEEAHAKRGAHWTFNGPSFVKAISELKQAVHSKLPSFDHNVKDPVEDDIEVLEHHQVVIVEGNYLHLDLDPWNQLASLWDDSWYLDCDMEVAMQRVFDRFLTMGLCSHEAQHRLDDNDSRNAELIASYAHCAQLIIKCAVDAAADEAMKAEE
ncbi:hypothetical protein WJX74_000964 [Apatococcus lobatus]|uniref:Phosphoribulokinase/uridine kinase domain-containing protein n=1 Tax=Apatococcus lobatus TaxID=904363 RepID=A0AAW1S1G3_9CHLO